MIIFLTGFMGAGKSTIGPILANTLGWNFYDLDKVIEEKEGKKIRSVFDEKGEEYFRKIETETLEEISGGENIIISLGGGTMVNNKNLEILKNRGLIIYLKTSPEAMYKRLRFKRDRPNIKVNEKENFTREELMNRIENLFNKRKEYYEQADISINTDLTSVGITVDKIADIIKNHLKNRNNSENN